jgi:hydrogenase maturation protease
MLKVIGIGNIIRGDDGIGPSVIQELEQSFPTKLCTLVDAGVDAFTVLEHLMQSDPILMIDCVKMGKNPGEIRIFKLDQVNISKFDSVISLHGYRFTEIFKIAQALGSIPKCTLIGIEPKTIEFNKNISKEVEQSIPSIINLVIEEAKLYGKKNPNN